jgi:hypothetical protein
MSNQAGKSGGVNSRRSGRKDYNVSSLCRIAMQKIVGDFDTLPVWAKKEVFATLSGKYPGLVTTVSNPPDNAKLEPSSTDGIPSGTSGKKTAKKGKGTSGSESEVKPAATVRKLHGYERPIIKDLLVSQRLAKLTAEERKGQSDDLAILSSAIAAMSRASKSDVTDDQVRGQFSNMRESVKNFSRCWPSMTTIKEYALQKLLKANLSELPMGKSCGNVNVFRTAVTVEPLKEDMMVDGKPPPILSRVSYHDVGLAGFTSISSAITAFLSEERGNYQAIEKYVHVDHGYLYLYWVPASAGGIRWGDEDDEISLSPSTPTPRRKKKRQRKGSKDDDMDEDS